MGNYGHYEVSPRSASVRCALPVLTLGSPGALWAASLPGNGTVAHGSATIGQPDLSTLNFNQQSSKAILNWESFSIGSGKTVNFDQASSSAIALNRVLGNDPSSIYGNITAHAVQQHDGGYADRYRQH